MTHLFHLLERKSAIHFCHIVWSIVFLKALNWDFCRKNLRFGDPCQNRGRYVARCLRMVEWTQEVRQYFLEGEGWLIEHEDNDDSNDSWFMLSCVIFLVLLRSECFVKDFCHFWWGSYQYVRCPVCSFDFFDVVLVFHSEFADTHTHHLFVRLSSSLALKGENRHRRSHRAFRGGRQVHRWSSGGRNGYENVTKCYEKRRPTKRKTTALKRFNF